MAFQLQSVITRLNGGLGNQLFQYAAGRALANRLGVPLKMDLSEFETYELRQFELDKFSIDARIVAPGDTVDINIRPSSLQRRFSRAAIYLGISVEKIAFREKGLGYDSAFGKIRRPMYLNGYWQSERYFKSVEDQLRSELCPIKELGEASQTILNEIVQCHAVSLHIRRGDYVTNPSAAAVHGVCPLDYYYTAIRHITSHLAEPRFFVFSDDPQWAKTNLKIGHPVQFVEANRADDGIQDMWLMKSCKHHIIANSSFSWWAAWLNESLDKTVIAPRTWFLDKSIDDSDLIPKQWLRI